MTIFEYLHPTVNVALAVAISVWCIYCSSRASCSLGRIGMSVLGTAGAFIGGFIYGVSVVLGGLLK